ncbi:hypothetical protein ACO0R3_003847 [Hanseniaspora guilliermondii]
MTDTYENNLWTFLNLEEDDQEKLNELAHEIKDKIGENYFKLKLKVAIQSNDDEALNILGIKDDDLLVKESDSAELTLLKKKIFDKYALSINNFDELFTKQLEFFKHKDSEDIFVQNLVDYITSNSSDKDQVRKKTLKLLEGEPENEPESPYSKENIINRFKEMWEKNNDIYAKITSEYKNNVDKALNKMLANFEKHIHSILRLNSTFSLSKDTKFNILKGFVITASLLILLIGVKFGKSMKRKIMKLITRIKTLLTL